MVILDMGVSWIRWRLVLLVIPGALLFQRVTGDIDEATTRNIEADFDGIFRDIIRKAAPLASEVAGSPELSGPCSASLLKFFLHLRLKEPWALRMLTANGLLPTNLFEGSFINLGGYEQCLKTRLLDSEGKVTLKGQYCSLFVKPPKALMESTVKKFQKVGLLRGREDPLTFNTDTRVQSVDFRLGICMPSPCSSEELNFLVRSVFNKFGINSTIKGCRTDDPKPVTRLQAACICFFCALTLLVGLGTLTEWHFKRQATVNAKRSPGSACRVLIWFSVVTNTRRLFDTSQFKGTSREPLLFLSGIKLILCFWVVFFHSYTIIQPEFYHSGFKIFDLGDRIYFQLIVNAFLSISSLFFIRGFTFSFFMNETSTYRGSSGYIRTYIFATIKRYLRLTMPVVVVMLLAFLLPIMADGPADQELFTQQINGCAKNWWTVLVHTNNFNPLNESCLTSLWYVSTEMQVFVITLPLTMLLSRFPRTAATILVLTALGFSIYTTLRTYFWNLFFSMTTGSNNGKRLFQTLELIYFRPFTHVATYVCGILSGYAAVHYKKRNIPYMIQSTLWLLSATAAGFVMFVTVPWNRGNLPDDITNALYGGFHRLVWSLALCWPIYACATGHGGIIAWMSSWKGFIPLARLTYGVYLLHGLFLLLRMGLVKSRFNLDEFFQLTNTLGIIALSYYFAYLLYLVCEAPIENFSAAVFDRCGKKELSNSSKPVSNGQNTKV
ncbi:nose resistant to fluoxetine protein 6 [Ixodes scapularis]